MFKKDDLVILNKPFYHLGTDIGNRLGRVLDTKSYILVEVYEYENNPVKCFSSEVEKVNRYQKKHEVSWPEFMEDEDTQPI